MSLYWDKFGICIAFYSIDKATCTSNFHTQKKSTGQFQVSNKYCVSSQGVQMIHGSSTGVIQSLDQLQNKM